MATVDDLPERWRERLAAYLRERGRDRLSAYDFPAGSLVRLTFPDGSTASFRHAFCLIDGELREIAVLTEHCGYHVFPAAGVGIHREP